MNAVRFATGGDWGAARLLYSFDNHVLDTDRRELRRGANAIAVEPQVFDLLEYLIRNRERVVSRDDVLAAVWGGRIVSESALATRINAARKAVGDTGERQNLIRTIARKGFRFVGEVRQEQEPRAPTARAAVEASNAAPVLPDRPSIVVLPFSNMSGDPEQEYFADGITEDIMTALAHVRQLFVIARNTAFTYKGRPVDVQALAKELGVRYVLEGSVRRAGDRVRITAQLIEGATGNHLWAERYDRELQDIFAVQNEITQMVVGAIGPELGRAEQERARLKPPNSLRAWDHYQHGLWHLWRLGAKDIEEAIAFFKKSIQLDSAFSSAFAALSYAHATNFIRGYTASGEAELQLAYDTAMRAVVSPVVV